MTIKYDELDSLNSRLKALRPFNVALSKTIQQYLMLNWTYNSNAIEGNTLNYNETSFYLLRGLTAKGKSIKEHLEATNHKDAIQYLHELVNKNKNVPITEKLIREIHALLFKGDVDPNIEAGIYKSQDNHVLKADGTIHYYTPSISVPSEMKKLVMMIKKNESKLHPVELSTIFHYELVRIHPFTDGNGRIARLIMNLILIKNDYPPAVIRNEMKNKYYDALEAADRGNKKQFFKFVSTEIAETIKLIINIATGKGDKFNNKHLIYEKRVEKGLSQIELSKITGIGQAMISRIENNNEKPTLKTLKKIAKALRVSVKDLS